MEEKCKKKNYRLLVLSLYPEATKEMYGEQIRYACYDNANYKSFDEIDCESIEFYDTYLIHLMHVKNQFDIMSALSHLGLIIGMTKSERVFLIEDPELCHGFDEKVTKSIRQIIDSLEKLSQCEIINILNETTEDAFFAKLTEEFEVPKNYIGYLTDDEEWIDKKFAALAGKDYEKDKDNNVRFPLHVDLNDIGLIPQLSRGYIYNVWYGKYKSVTFKPNLEQSKSVVFRGKNNRTLIIKGDRSVQVYVWLKPMDDDFQDMMLFDELNIDIATVGVSTVKPYINMVRDFNSRKKPDDPRKIELFHFISKDISKDKNLIMRGFSNLLVLDAISISRQWANLTTINTIDIREDFLE